MKTRLTEQREGVANWFKAVTSDMPYSATVTTTLHASATALMLEGVVAWDV
jgi:hypothetical protein